MTAFHGFVEFYHKFVFETPIENNLDNFYSHQTKIENHENFKWLIITKKNGGLFLKLYLSVLHFWRISYTTIRILYNTFYRFNVK